METKYYKDKDGKYLKLDYLKTHTEEETKKWAEANLRSEIKQYNDYCQGNVYDGTIYEFNPKTMDWDEIEVFQSLITSDMENWLKDYYKQSEPKEIHSQIIPEMMNTPTPEYKQAVFEKYVSKIKEVMPEFDGNLQHAARAVTIALKDNPSSKLEKDALTMYMQEKGCKSPESTFKFLEESLGIKSIAKEFNPYEPGYEVYFHTNPNPNSSNYHSKSSPLHALVIDKKNKRYGLLSGSYSFSGNKFNWYQKIPNLSIKKLREKIEELKSYGLKFQKFTTAEGEYAQGNPKELYPKNKQKEIESRYER